MHDSMWRPPSPARARAPHVPFCIAGVLCAVGVGWREARADDPAPTRNVHLEVAGDAEGCPKAAEVAAAANRVLGRERVRTSDASARDAELRIVVAFSREPGGFGATVRESGARDAERTIPAGERTCDTLTSAVGATIAMMIDAVDGAGGFVPQVSATAQAEGAAATHVGQAPPDSASSGPASAPDPDRVVPPLDEGAPAHSGTARDGIFVEALGNGVYDSLNYERMFWNRTFSVRMGLGFAPLSVCPAPCGNPLGIVPPHRRVDEFTSPVLASWYWGSASHKLQVGLGVTAIFRTGEVGHDGYQDWFSGGQYDNVFSHASKGFDLAGTAVVGYRFIPARGGPSFGGGFTPLFGAGGFLPWLSVNAGAEFM
jgi:hypothetical protein